MSADLLRTRRRAGSGTRSPAVLALLAAAVLAPAPAPAHADAQAAIEPQRLALVGPVEAGDEDALPTLTVANTGDSPGTFVVQVRSFADPAATPPEAAWLRIDPAEFDLAPGEERTVTITVAPDA